MRVTSCARERKRLCKDAGTLLPHVGAEGVPKATPQCPRIFSQTGKQAVVRVSRPTAPLRSRLVRIPGRESSGSERRGREGGGRERKRLNFSPVAFSSLSS